jgi:hypothetical protein
MVETMWKSSAGMYIKWQCKWFGNKFLFLFLNSPSELTFWITYTHHHPLDNNSESPSLKNAAVSEE